MEQIAFIRKNIKRKKFIIKLESAAGTVSEMKLKWITVIKNANLTFDVLYGDR